MHIRLAAICAVFIALGAAIFFITRPPEPATPVDAPPLVETASPGTQDDADTSVEPADMEGVTDLPAPSATSDAVLLYGLVVDARSGAPVTGAEILVRESAEGFPERALTDATGAYEFRVQQSQRDIYARADGYSVARMSMPVPAQARQRLDFSLRQGGVITGQVVENRTDAPIEGMVVNAVPAEANLASSFLGRSRRGGGPAPSNMGQETTDAEGQFTITGLDPGSYRVTLEARAKGFLFPSDQAQVVTIDEGTTAEEVYFALDRGAVVVGMVMGPDRRPAAGASVRAVPRNAIGSIVRGLETQDTQIFAELATKAGDDGRFELAGLEYETEYRLQGKADGFAPSASEPFLIPRNQPRVTVDVMLSLGATVSGDLVLTDGAPLASHMVMLWPSGETMVDGAFDGPITAESDESGVFAFARVPAGSFQLGLMPRDDYQLAEPDRGGIALDIDGKSDYAGLRLVAEPAPERTFETLKITGVVYDSAGSPASGVQVSAQPAFIGRGVSFAQTGPDGRFELTRLPGRRFDVIARTDFGRAKLEGVPIGSDVVLRLRPPARVSGIVLDSQNRPVPDCEVRLESTQRPQPEDPAEEIMMAVGGMMGDGEHVQQTENTGYFLFSDVEPGEYSVQAVSRTLGAGESYKFALSEGQDLTNVQVRLEPGITFAGIVQDGTGMPVSGAFVKMNPLGPGGEMQQMVSNFMPMAASQQGVSGASQRDGRFQLLNVIPGSYTLEATHARYAKTVQTGVRVEKGADVRNHVVILTEGGRARGQYAPGGQARAGTMILVLGESGMQMATTAFDGSFELDNVSVGPYMVLPLQFDQGQDPSQFLEMWNRAQVVDIADGELSEISFEPPAGGQPVGGSITGDTGATTIVTLRRPGGPDPTTINPLNMREAMQALRYQVAAGIANPDGSFTFDSVPPGDYVLDAISLNIDLNNPDPSLLFNISQFPRITMDVTVGNAPLEVDLAFE